MASAQETPSTVHVKNIAPQTTSDQVRDFFSFCGKIQDLSVSSDGSTQSASVTFEKANAAKTALLLDNTQLGPNQVAVSASPSLAEAKIPESGTAAAAAAGPGSGQHHVAQDDKPRSRILAEYLAHGYTVSDKAIAQAIAMDNQHGISTRFTSALRDFDSKYKATERAQGLDKQYGVSERGSAAWNGLSSYFEKALGTPTGQKVRAFYEDGSKQVLDVHNEARRLADLRAASGPAMAGGAGGAPGATPAGEKAGDPLFAKGPSS